MLYIKFTKEKNCYRITFSGKSTKASEKLVKQYIEKLNKPVLYIPKFT